MTKTKRTGGMVLGILFIGLCVSFLRLSQFGVDPFSAMNLGISGFIGWSFGTWQLLVNAIILVVVFFQARSCIGAGTIINSNHSGGTLGGMSDGSQLILRAAIKPTPSISQMQHTVTNSGEEIELSIHGRHDPIIVPRAVVVVEAMTALTLADLLLRNAVSRMNQIKQLYTEDKNV